MMIKNSLFINFLTILLISSCTLAPGMHMPNPQKDTSGENYVYVESLDKRIDVININLYTRNNDDAAYRIGIGDQLSITVWGLQEIFPIVNLNSDQNLRRVDSNGNIYFPYVGEIKAEGKTATELRQNLTQSLSTNFNDPQLDLTVARFNSQKVFLLGEVTKPSRINLTDVPLTLTDALGEVMGLNTSSSNGSEVFIIRRGQQEDEPLILRANLNSPSGFIDAGEFYLKNNDIVYVNAKGTTRWNRVISQFFPFSTFLNSVDNLTRD